MIRPANFQSLKDVIDSYVKLHKLTDGILEAKIKEHWAAVTGKLISQRTLSITFKSKELVIRLNSSVVREELTYQSDELRKNLNNLLGSDAIATIKFL